MNKLINSVSGDVIDTPAGGAAALRGRACRTPSAAFTVPADGAAARPARTVQEMEWPELTRSRVAPVDTPALRWGR